MEPKFQTSFIPKKPLTASAAAPAPHSVSVFMTLSLIVFIVSLAGAGFAYAWQQVLMNEQSQYKADLAKDQDEFNTTLITTLKTADTKITVAKQLLQNHLAVSQIFGIISQLTVSTVQWKSLDFSLGNGGSGGGGSSPNALTITMSGVADSFYSIAYQSDVLGQSSMFGANKVIQNPVLSNLSVDPTTGHVGFSFTARVDQSALSYESEVAGQAVTPVSSTTVPTGSAAVGSSTPTL